jgi:dihydroorotate dehydrogenase (fumarate)
MTRLQTTYMGIPISNPIVVGACSMSKKIDAIKAVEDAGAGALVIKSLFEEQVHLEEAAFEQRMAQFDNPFAEAQSLFPSAEHAGPKHHLYWVARTRKETKLPLIASLNCLQRDTWVQYARQLEETGVDGLELNFYSPALDPNVTAAQIEANEVETLAAIRAAVRLPLSVKLHPYYTSTMNHAANLQKAGAGALILFNRLFQPDIDVDREEKMAQRQLTLPNESLVPLRWTALLSQRIEADIIASTGLRTGKDVAKMVLVGAQAVQVVSALYAHSPSYVKILRAELLEWMDAHGYQKLDDFRGKLARRKLDDAWSFERGQYVKAILGFD